MPAILATLLFTAFAVPALIPGTAPGIIPASLPMIAAPTVIPAGATPLFPADPTTVPFPGGFPIPGGFQLPAPASVPAISNTMPALIPTQTAPALVPGFITPNIPFTPATAVPGVVPALVPGFTPGFVLPGTPQPFGPTFAPSTPATILSGSASGPCFDGNCNPTTGNRNYNGRTLFFTRTCTTCTLNNNNNNRIGNFATVTTTGCSGLTGNDFNDCCRAGLRDGLCGIASRGRPTTCTCNGVATTCPRCNNSKKGLLGLLGLLGLIPLLLCLSLLSCLLWLCCIRGTKKGPETHFATYQPQAIAQPTIIEQCAPVATHCDVPYGATNFGHTNYA